VCHEDYPALPASVPLTYTLTMLACLSARPADRPSFSQMETVMKDMAAEVATGRYLNSAGQVMVRALRRAVAAGD
jgi:hypothetical protein